MFCLFTLQHNDDPELFAELKRKEVEYERRRNKRVQYFESVRTAQTVQIEDIPLPDISEKPPAQAATAAGGGALPATVPPGSQPPPNFQPPGMQIQIPPSIHAAIAAHQKAQADEKSEKSEPKQKEPPGCPPGPPPDLLEMRELDSDYESEDSDRGSRRSPVPSKRPRRRYSSDRSSVSNHSDERQSDSEPEIPKPTSVQQRMLAIAGQKYDDFMKELENVHSQQADERAQASKRSDRKRDGDDDGRNGSAGDESMRSNRDNNAELKSQANESNKPNAHGMKTSAGDGASDSGAPPGLRKENPAAIPNMSSIPAPPMPPPMLHKMPRPPPPPMGTREKQFFFDIHLQTNTWY